MEIDIHDKKSSLFGTVICLIIIKCIIYNSEIELSKFNSI